MAVPNIHPSSPVQRETSDYRDFMVRELLIWVIGVPVPIAAVIGFFVL
jgi:hypothetical protein